MSLSGRVVSQTETKASGDLFHETFAHKPHHLASSFPDIVQSFELLGGSFGTAGSVVLAKYTLEGKKSTAKAIIEGVDDNRKSITYKIVEGDLLQLYKTFKATINVDSKGSKSTVTCIMEYVKVSPNAPDPNSVMDMFVTLVKGIEARQTI